MRNTFVSFPSQAVSDLEKLSHEYGEKVAKAIRHEWFSDRTNKYAGNLNEFRKLRLYARGEQSIDKYKNELSINGDLSYLNLDWKPVPIIPKFVDIVVNGMAQRTWYINCFSQDAYGVSKRTEYMEALMRDMQARAFNETVKQAFGMDLYETPPERLPDSEEELQLHMQLSYKQAVELAEEQALNVLFEGSDYDLIRRRSLYDICTIGIGATKTTFDYSEGAKVEYVDPADLIWSHTDSPYFDDLYYVGEVKEIPINELYKQFPELTESELEEITEYSRDPLTHTPNHDNNLVHVLYFNYKTHSHDIYKLKKTKQGGEKVIKKDDKFNPPAAKQKEGEFEKLDRVTEVLFEGVFVLGSQKLLQWRMAPNMMRTKSDFSKVKMNYQIVAPRM